MSRLLLLCWLALLAACGGGSAPAAPPQSAAPAAAAAPADIQLLFLGNSHTANHDVPGSVAAMLRAGRPGKAVLAERAPGAQFLDARWRDPATMALLQQRAWSAVVLQAQQYSSSGAFEYSTLEAEMLAQEVRRLGAVPVMFPEWPRLGIAETQRIYDLHRGIAQKQAACVAPIGQAWDIAAARWPALVLHERDGNHAAAPGAFLAALVLYATLTGLSPDELPALPVADVDASTQALLRSAASEAVRIYAPRALCPGDRLL